jgi:hypothetical protein
MQKLRLAIGSLYKNSIKICYCILLTHHFELKDMLAYSEYPILVDLVQVFFSCDSYPGACATVHVAQNVFLVGLVELDLGMSETEAAVRD